VTFLFVTQLGLEFTNYELRFAFLLTESLCIKERVGRCLRVERSFNARQPDLVIAAGRAKRPICHLSERGNENAHGVVDRIANAGLNQFTRRHRGLRIGRVIQDYPLIAGC